MANRKVQTTMYKTLHRKQRPSNTNPTKNSSSGADPRGGRGAHPKIGKNMIFLRKIVIFHTKYPNNFRAIFLSAPSPLTWIPGSAPGHAITLQDIYIYFFVVLEVTYAKLTLIPSSWSINIRGCPSFSADTSCLTCCRRAGCDRGDCDHYTCKCSGCPWHWLGIILPTRGNHSDFIWTWCHFKKLIKFKITYLFYFSIIEHIHPDKNKCRFLLWFVFVCIGLWVDVLNGLVYGA